MMSTGVPSGRNGISSSGIMRAITPLLAVSARHLVALGYLASLSNPQADKLVHAGREFIIIVPAEHSNFNDLAALSHEGHGGRYL